MSYFAVDDEMHAHPKMVPLSLAAVGLWARCGSWAKKYRTGGHVPLGAVRTLGGNRKLALELCKVQPGEERALWSETEGGFQFHDWEEYQLRGLPQTPKEKQAAYRAREKAKKEEAARLRAEAEGEARYQEGNGSGNGIGNEESNGSVDNVTCLPARAHTHGVGGGVGNTPSSTEDAEDPLLSPDPLSHHALCARWAKDVGMLEIDVSGKDRFAAEQFVQKCNRLGMDWRDVYARWRADERFVQAEEPPLTHLNSQFHKYLRDRPKSAPKGPAKAAPRSNTDPEAPLVQDL